MEPIQIVVETEWGLDVKIRRGEFLGNLNFLEQITPILSKCYEKGRKRILIDLGNFEQNVTITKLFEAVNISHQIVGGGLKLALIAPKLMNDEKSKFVETAGLNRGIFIQYFKNRPQALKWLVK